MDYTSQPCPECGILPSLEWSDPQDNKEGRVWCTIDCQRIDCHLQLNPTWQINVSDAIIEWDKLVEQHEQKTMGLPDPIEAIKFRMDQMSWSNVDMIKYFGCASKASEVLSRKRRMSLTMIRKLFTLGIPAEVLIQSYELKG